jgi:hypothetical protein
MNMAKKNDSAIAPTAADLVGAAESIVLGDGEHSARVSAAAAAVEVTLSAAADQIFRPALSTSADVIALFEWHKERAGLAAFGEKLARIHKLALSEQPALSALIRASDVLEDVHVRATAAAPAGGHLESIAERDRRVGTAAVRRFQVEIATQLFDAGIEAAAASAFLAAVKLEQRLAVVRERHAAHAQAEAERAERHAKEAAELARAERIAAVAAARSAFESAREDAERAARAYRDIRAKALVDRIRDSGAESLTHERRIWSTAMIVDMIDSWGLEQLAEFEAAIEQHEAKDLAA